MTETPAQMVTEGVSFDIRTVMQLIPHRYPMLLIDRVQDLVPGESCVGIKNVTINEPFFAGHFPGHPVMPGVLIIEALAQTAAALVMHGMKGDETGGRIVYFMAIDDARFRRPVMPGDQLHLKVRKKRRHGMVWRFAGEALVDGAVAAEAVVTAMIRDE